MAALTRSSRSCMHLSAFRSDDGSAIVGWVMVAPMVIAVALGAVDITHSAVMTSRVHSAVTRIAYVAATASDEATRQRIATEIARSICDAPRLRWTPDVVAGIPMVFAELQCRYSTVVGPARTVVSRAHAPMEIP